MTEKEKELKAFNQCADALNVLDKRSIIKVFQLLSVHFEFMPILENLNKQNSEATPTTFLLSHQDGGFSETSENNDGGTKTKKSNGSIKKAKASSSSNTPVFLADFDFRPTNNEALKDFYSKFQTESNYENNLLFIYYFQEILKEDLVTLNHVFSCYRHLGLKIPSFPQSLKDTKKAKGWITANPSDLKVTRAGINYLEHEMKKSDGQQS